MEHGLTLCNREGAYRRCGWNLQCGNDFWRSGRVEYAWVKGEKFLAVSALISL